MSEKEESAPVAEESNQGQVVSSSGGAKKKRARKVWTIQQCKRSAGRYGSEEAWKVGSPSSYKAAKSNNWLKDCMEHQSWRLKDGPSDSSLPQSA